MSTHCALSRREFLKLAGIAASAAALRACASQSPIATAPAAATQPGQSGLSIFSPKISKMVLVEPGSFEMGATDGAADQRPVHTVAITRAFQIAKYAVVFDDYDAYCAAAQKARPTGRGTERENRPAHFITWPEALDYCNWLSEQEGLTPCYTGKGRVTACDFSANGYRLPTEAEWEYAARGGRLSQGYKFAGSDKPDDVAWYDVNSGRKVHAVGEKQPNELGLYDMSGNMWEWCWDYYDPDCYTYSPSTDPIGPDTPLAGASAGDTERVRRSGIYDEGVDAVRVSFRSSDVSNYRGGAGIRLVRTV
jgi:sulfatase modifying factor 1